jgi:hypothetical protein
MHRGGACVAGLDWTTTDFDAGAGPINAAAVRCDADRLRRTLANGDNRGNERIGTFGMVLDLVWLLRQQPPDGGVGPPPPGDDSWLAGA